MGYSAIDMDPKKAKEDKCEYCKEIKTVYPIYVGLLPFWLCEECSQKDLIFPV